MNCTSVTFGVPKVLPYGRMNDNGVIVTGRARGLREAMCHEFASLAGSTLPAGSLVHPIIGEFEAFISDRWDKMDDFDFEAYMATAHKDIKYQMFDVAGERIANTEGIEEYSKYLANMFSSWNEIVMQIKHVMKPPTWFRVETDGDVTVRATFEFFQLPKSLGVHKEDLPQHPNSFAASGYHHYRLRPIKKGSLNVADWRIVDFEIIEHFSEIQQKWLADMATESGEL